MSMISGTSNSLMGQGGSLFSQTAPKDSQVAQVPKGPLDMTAQSSGMMQEYIEGGVISVQSTNDFFEKCQLVVDQAFSNAVADAADSRRRVEGFCRELDKAVEKFSSFAYKLIEEIDSATPDQITRYKTVHEISKDLIMRLSH